MLRMVIADDHALLRSGLVRLFRSEFEIVAETSDGESTVSAVARLRPDVLLLDVCMPRSDPTGMVSRFTREHPGMRIVMLTGTADHSGLHGMLGLGVAAIVLKGSGIARLREAIARALEHRVYVDPDLRIAEPATTPCLTARECEVMELLAHGDSYRDIGSQLHLGERTIETYRRRIADKLGVRSRAELVAYALRHHVVQAVPDGPKSG